MKHRQLIGGFVQISIDAVLAKNFKEEHDSKIKVEFPP